MGMTTRNLKPSSEADKITQNILKALIVYEDLMLIKKSSIDLESLR